MSLPNEGLFASMSIGGTAIAYLSEVTLQVTRDYKEWVSMGTTVVSDVLMGAVKFKGHAKSAYIDNTFISYVYGGSILAGSITPRGGSTPYLAGSIQFVNCNLANMKQEEAAAVMNECDFILYAVTKSA